MPPDASRQRAEPDLDGSTDLAEDISLRPATQRLGKRLRITSLQEVVQEGIDACGISRGKRPLRSNRPVLALSGF